MERKNKRMHATHHCRLEGFVDLRSCLRLVDRESMSKEIKNSLFLADKCYPGSRKLLISKCLKLETEFKLYETFLMLVLSYGSES
jgi:hypothetical protein